jgi:segregation and condensation protein B
MERRLVKIVGKRDVPGKPLLYGTTTDFLQYFGLKDLASLPTLKEFQELEAGEDALVKEADEETASAGTGMPGQDERVVAAEAGQE